MLNVILKRQRFTNNRSGIGYSPELDKKRGRKKNGERSYLNYFQILSLTVTTATERVIVQLLAFIKRRERINQ